MKIIYYEAQANARRIFLGGNFGRYIKEFEKNTTLESAKHTKNLINLYSYNLTAYESAIEKLTEKGNSMMLHPIVTDKFFIAYKLCENSDDKRIWRFSPSGSVFNTLITHMEAGSNVYCRRGFDMQSRLCEQRKSCKKCKPTKGRILKSINNGVIDLSEVHIDSISREASVGV